MDRRGVCDVKMNIVVCLVLCTSATHLQFLAHPSACAHLHCCRPIWRLSSVSMASFPVHSHWQQVHQVPGSDSDSDSGYQRGWSEKRAASSPAAPDSAVKRAVFLVSKHAASAERHVVLCQQRQPRSAVESWPHRRPLLEQRGRCWVVELAIHCYVAIDDCWVYCLPTSANYVDSLATTWWLMMGDERKSLSLSTRNTKRKSDA